MIVILGMFAVMVAPGSQGPSFVSSIGNAFSGSLSAAENPFHSVP